MTIPNRTTERIWVCVKKNNVLVICISFTTEYYFIIFHFNPWYLSLSSIKLSLYYKVYFTILSKYFHGNHCSWIAITNYSITSNKIIFFSHELVSISICIITYEWKPFGICSYKFLWILFSNWKIKFLTF